MSYNNYFHVSFHEKLDKIRQVKGCCDGPSGRPDDPNFQAAINGINQEYRKIMEVEEREEMASEREKELYKEITEAEEETLNEKLFYNPLDKLDYEP